ncbi:membrane hypothetical protein [Tenacibaculum sp. 190524A05c]|uniref:hypothetical protein n=1 Tax=Tenacibaculum platacis TaxID=3137852 RepID=UPI0031FAD1A9
MEEPKIKKDYLSMIFEKIKYLKTSLQLGGFTLGIILVIYALGTPDNQSILKITTIFIPLILIAVIFNGNFIQKADKGNWLLKVIILVVVLIVFSTYAFIAYSLYNTSKEPLEKINPESINIGNISQKIDKVKGNNFKIKSNVENYNIISNFYFELLNNKISSNSFNMTTALKREMNKIRAEISNVKKENSNVVFGTDTIPGTIKKLQHSLLMLNFSEHIIDVIYNCLAKSEKKYSIDEIVDITNWNINPRLKSNLRTTNFSGIEKDLIKEIGKEIIIKSIDSFTVEDVKQMKLALNRLGLHNSNSDAYSNSRILDNFNIEINKYFNSRTRKKCLLAFRGNPLQQIAMYLTLYKVGLIDLKKIIIKYSSGDYKKALVKELLNTELELFNSSDINVLKKWINTKEKITNTDIVLVNTLKKIEQKLNDLEVKNIFESKSIDEYVIRSIDYSFNHNLQEDGVREILNRNRLSWFDLLRTNEKGGLELFKDLSYFLHLDSKLLFPKEFQEISLILLGEKKSLSGLEKDLKKILEIYNVKESNVLSNLISS